MAESLFVYAKVMGDFDTDLISLGSTQVPVSVNTTGHIHKRTAIIANAANTVVYNDELGTFNFCWLASDYNTRVLITDNASASFSIQLLGTGTSGSYGVPLMLALDETSNSSATINAIQVFNNSGSTAQVQCLVIL